MEAIVSDILRSRMREPGGLTQTAALSIAAHAAAIVALALVPGLLPKSAPPPRNVMTISLAGTPGPKTGGMRMIGGRPIIAATPSTAPKIEKTTMPTLKAEPAMVMPVPDPKLKPKTPPKPTVTSKDPQGTAVGRGFETQKGSTPVDTGVRGQGFGLSTSGGGGSGSTLDTKDFCCPEYLADMRNRIESNWVKQQQSTGVVLMKFTILRNGQIVSIEPERPSNITSLDLASERALYTTGRLAPLPGAYPDDHLTVHLEFKYERQ
jgi:outer membrane biosynthesis protein TonB